MESKASDLPAFDRAALIGTCGPELEQEKACRRQAERVNWLRYSLGLRPNSRRKSRLKNDNWLKP